VGNGTKHTVIDDASADRYTIDVVLRFSSNISRNCRPGPERNTEDMSDMTFPVVYRKTKGAGLPAASLTNSRKDMNVVR
jgi:hypothetical protein